MRLFTGLLLILLFSFQLPSAQTATNLKIKEFTISNFSNDSLKSTAWFPVGDAEGLSVLIKSPVKDSSNFAVIYQRGYPDGSGGIIAKRPGMLVDTFNTLTAGNFQNAGGWINSLGSDSDLVQAIDSLQVNGYVCMLKNVYAYRSPYGRFFIKGLTSNKKSMYSVYITAIQPKYTNVNTGN